MSYIFKDADVVKTAMRSILAKYPETEFDLDLRLDMMEGETDLFVVVSQAVKERAEAIAFEKAIDGMIDDLSLRAERYKDKAEVLKSLIQMLMAEANVDKITLPEATISRQKGRVSVDVMDVYVLPQGYFQIERKADKAAIKTAIESGETIPGAALVTGEPSITIRVK